MAGRFVHLVPSQDLHRGCLSYLFPPTPAASPSAGITARWIPPANSQLSRARDLVPLRALRKSFWQLHSPSDLPTIRGRRVRETVEITKTLPMLKHGARTLS